MTSASVFAYVNEHHILPSVSRAAISDIRGATYLSVKVLGASTGAQTRLRNRVPFSQLSSTLIIRRPCSRRGSILKAYCYLSTRHLSRLHWIGTVFANR